MQLLYVRLLLVLIYNIVVIICGGQLFVIYRIVIACNNLLFSAVLIAAFTMLRVCLLTSKIFHLMLMVFVLILMMGHLTLMVSVGLLIIVFDKDKIVFILFVSILIKILIINIEVSFSICIFY